MSVASKLAAGIPQSLLDELRAEGGPHEDELLHSVSHLPAAIQVEPRRQVLAMPEYHPPLASRSMLRLDFNENTFAPSPRVFAKLQSLTAEGLTIYPEREHAEHVVAMHYGLQPAEVLLTNGVDEAIHLLACAFLEPTDEVLLCTPSFFMYDVSCSMMTSNIVRIQTDDTFAFPLSRFLAAITPRTKLIMIATPNNPTGQTVSREQILKICEAAPQAVVFADEAYFHFFGETSMDNIPAVPNLVVGRTFSKAYGMANLRLGMLAGPERLIGYSQGSFAVQRERDCAGGVAGCVGG
jgi:histidinol-phosphate aminotransferase